MPNPTIEKITDGIGLKNTLVVNERDGLIYLSTKYGSYYGDIDIREREAFLINTRWWGDASFKAPSPPEIKITDEHVLHVFYHKMVVGSKIEICRNYSLLNV